MDSIVNRKFWTLALCVLIASLSVSAADSFDRLSQINKASIVMLSETGIVPKPMAARIARGIRTVMADEATPNAKRSGDYLVFEEALVKAAGEDASRLHTGRSRQDIGTTSSRMEIREALLANCKASLDAREKLLDLASKHLGTVIPSYTHGLQAQPITLAHYLLAFASALDRDAERYESFWGRLNRSPLGAAALATSGFPLDRNRLAALLGFDGPVENSFDANSISPADTMVEFASDMGTGRVDDRPVRPGPAYPIPRSRAMADPETLTHFPEQHHAAKAQPRTAGIAAHQLHYGGWRCANGVATGA